MQQDCSICKHRFYVDEDSFVNGSWVCTYCVERIKKCYLCENQFTDHSEKNEADLCQPCKSKIPESSGITNRYLVLRFKTFERDRFTCRYCGRSPLEDLTVKLNADHIRARSKAGEDSLDNFVTSCQECNKGKIDRLLDKGIEELIRNRRKWDEYHSCFTAKRLVEVEDSQADAGTLADRPQMGARHTESKRTPLGKTKSIAR